MTALGRPLPIVLDGTSGPAGSAAAVANSRSVTAMDDIGRL